MAFFVGEDPSTFRPRPTVSGRVCRRPRTLHPIFGNLRSLLLYEPPRRLIDVFHSDMISLVNGDMPSQWMQRVRGAVAMQRQAPRCPAQPKLNASLGADPVAPRVTGHAEAFGVVRKAVMSIAGVHSYAQPRRVILRS